MPKWLKNVLGEEQRALFCPREPAPCLQLGVPLLEQIVLPHHGGWGCWRKMLLWASPQGACHEFPLVFVLGEMKVPVPPARGGTA